MGGAIWWMLTGWRPGVVDWSAGVFASCMPWVQLYVNACNGWPQFALQHHWLLPINCQFKRSWSRWLTVGVALYKNPTFTFTFTFFTFTFFTFTFTFTFFTFIVLCLLFVLLYFCCGKSAWQNLLVSQPCCHSELFTPLYYVVFELLLILFVILNVVIFGLRATTLMTIWTKQRESVWNVVLCSGEGSQLSGNSDERNLAAMARAILVHPDTIKVMYFAWWDGWSTQCVHGSVDGGGLDSWCTDSVDSHVTDRHSLPSEPWLLYRPAGGVFCLWLIDFVCDGTQHSADSFIVASIVSLNYIHSQDVIMLHWLLASVVNGRHGAT